MVACHLVEGTPVQKRYLVPVLALPLALAAPLAAVASTAVQPGPIAKPDSVLTTASEPRMALARVIDRGSVNCSASSRMVSKLERDGQRLEVDAEIFGPARQSWVVRFVQNGDLAHKITRSADSDGELDVWRYLPNRPGEDRVKVQARSAQGETCVIRLRG